MSVSPPIITGWFFPPPVFPGEFLLDTFFRRFQAERADNCAQ